MLGSLKAADLRDIQNTSVRYKCSHPDDHSLSTSSWQELEVCTLCIELL